MKMNTIERCRTGIPGFDELCEGGLVRSSVNVLLGGPGSGKTTFLLQFLWNGVNLFKENGLYLSFEPDINEVFQDAASYGWDFSILDSKEKCKFIKISPKISIQKLKEELTKIISKNDIMRVCIDPISVLSMSIDKESEVREFIFDLASLLKRLKVTVLLADETSDGTTEILSLGENSTRTQSLKFLVDGLINSYSSGLGGETDRAVRITKMRRTNHVRGPMPFKITDEGISVILPQPSRKIR